MKRLFFRTADAGSGRRFFRTSDTGQTVPVVLSSTNLNPQRGSSITLTMEDAGASQGGVTIGGVAQTITGWTATSIQLTVVRGALPYGVAQALVVTRADGISSAAFNIASIQPQGGWSYVVIGTPNATSSQRLTSTVDLATGNLVASGNIVGGGTVVVNPDGSFTASSTVTAFDFEVWAAGEGWGTSATQTITTPDLTPPSGYTASFNQSIVNNANKAAIGFTFANAEVGCLYNYTIGSSGGATAPVSGNGTISTANQAVTNINVSTLNDGLLTLFVRLIDDSENVGPQATAQVVKDVTAPSVTPPSNTIIQYNYGGPGLSRSALALQAWLAQATALDGVSGSIAVTNNITSLSDPIAAGTYTVTFSAVDGAGNPASANAQLTVQEAAAPPVDTGDTGFKYFRSLLRNLIK